MPWCRLEDSFHDDPKWDLIADVASIPAVMVMGHASALYSWCVRHAPDGVIGTLPMSAIMRAMRILDPKIFEIFVAFEVVVKTSNGYEVNGYARRSETYNASKRLAKHRKKKAKDETLQKRSKNVFEIDLQRTEQRDGNVEKREIDQKRKKREIDPTAFLAAHRKLLLEKRQKEYPPPSPNERKTARAIMEIWGDESIACLEHYVETNNQFYASTKWPLGVALRNAGEIYASFRDKKPKPQAKEKTLADLLAEQA